MRLLVISSFCTFPLLLWNSVSLGKMLYNSCPLNDKKSIEWKRGEKSCTLRIARTHCAYLFSLLRVCVVHLNSWCWLIFLSHSSFCSYLFDSAFLLVRKSEKRNSIPQNATLPSFQQGNLWNMLSGWNGPAFVWLRSGAGQTQLWFTMLWKWILSKFCNDNRLRKHKTTNEKQHLMPMTWWWRRCCWRQWNDTKGEMLTLFLFVCFFFLFRSLVEYANLMRHFV